MRHVLSIENLKIASINNKYEWNPKIGQLVLSRAYRDFKNLIVLKAKRGMIKPPYRVKIEIETYMDIDASIKAIFDGLEKAEVLTNDRFIHELQIKKTAVKRGSPNKLDVWVETIK